MQLFLMNAHQFFTSWFLVLLVAHKYTADHFDLHLLAWFVMIAFAYIQFIEPRYIQLVDPVTDVMYFMTGWDLGVVTAVFHLIPFLYTMWVVHVNKDNRLAQTNTLGVIVLYLLLFNPERVYHLHIGVFIVAFIVSWILTLMR